MGLGLRDTQLRRKRPSVVHNLHQQRPLPHLHSTPFRELLLQMASLGLRPHLPFNGCHSPAYRRSVRPGLRA